MSQSFSQIQDETVCDKDVSIILMTNEYEILISKMETNAIIDTASMKTVSDEKWFLNFLKWHLNFLNDTALNKELKSFLIEKYLNLMVEKSLFKI